MTTQLRTDHPSEPVAEHSPLPWTGHDDDGTGTLPCILSDKVNAFGNFYVAQCNQFADVRFIVKAANNHQALVDALQAVNEIIVGCDEEWQRHRLSLLGPTIRAVLTAVEAQK